MISFFFFCLDFCMSLWACLRVIWCLTGPPYIACLRRGGETELANTHLHASTLVWLGVCLRILIGGIQHLTRHQSIAFSGSPQPWGRDHVPAW